MFTRKGKDTMTIDVVITATTTPPVGSVVAMYSYSITGVGTPVVTEALTASFADPAPGSYTAVVQAVDATGAPVGPALSATFVVPTPVVGLNLPTTITVAVS
jgi:hypothetical protein